MHKLRVLALKVWSHVHEPRAVAVAQAVVYVILGAGGVSALIDPPRTLEGAIGFSAMLSLAGLLVMGCLIGVPSALFGFQWLEKFAVYAVAMSAGIYCSIVLTMQVTSSGNRWLQLSFIATVLVSQFIRWVRIKDFPFDRKLTITDPIG